MIDDSDLLSDSSYVADFDKTLLDVAIERVDNYIIGAVVLGQRHFGPTICKDDPGAILQLAGLLAAEYDVVSRDANGDQTSFSEKLDMLRAAAMELVETAQAGATPPPHAAAASPPPPAPMSIGIVPASPATVVKP
jgi:hypothetical protein